MSTCLALVSSLAVASPANPSRDLSDSWKINGNGYSGDLVISQNAPGGRIQGTMYGDKIVGYFAPDERTAVIVRYSWADIPSQAFVGQVSADGGTWSGRFYGLDGYASGATQARNVFAFTATRGTSNVPPTPPEPYSPPGASEMGSNFTIYNRPQEFGTGWPGVLNITLGSVANPNFGQLDGTVFGNEFIGHYAGGTGTIAFLRFVDREPTQVYIGRDSGSELVVWQMSGTFYPLTEGMGASPTRLTYDWRAIP